MDNILKLLLGVLGVAGLLALLTPSEFAPSEAPPAVVEQPPAEPAPPPPPAEEQIVAEGEDYNFKIGEPTIDGNPIADPEGSVPNEFNSQPSSEQSPAAPAPVGQSGQPATQAGSTETPALVM